VNPQVAATSKPFITHLTCVSFVTRMNTFVSYKVADKSELFITYITYVWFVTRMNTFVSYKII